MTIDFNRALRRLKEGVTTSLGTPPAEAADVMVRGIQRGLDVANSVSRQVLISGGPLASLPTFALYGQPVRLFRCRPLEEPRSHSGVAATTFLSRPRRQASAAIRNGSVDRVRSSDW